VSPEPLTLANRLTLLRILLIPVFVVLVLAYAAGCRQGRPSEIQRVSAILAFAAAALTDALDGYVARSRRQQTQLGAYLDPIADKALLLTAILLFSFDLGDAYERFPTWFPVIVVARDVVLVGGIALLQLLRKPVAIRPSILGKLATLTQILAVVRVMVGFPIARVATLAAVAGAITILAGIQYVRRGLRVLGSAPTAGAS
jgi:CDP-diacylglycerol--glycerol-3-phosphate 3-phosphatidyltransferase